jgi:hypothetical protein
MCGMRSRKRWKLRSVLIAAMTVMAAGVALWLAGIGCCGRGRNAAGLSASLSTTRSATQAALRGDLLEGNWAGRWTSGSSDMDGELRCQVTKLEGGDYEAKFDATFLKVLNHQSTVTLKVREKGDSWKFDGEKDLGILNGGIYQYDGLADGEEFVCTYDSSMDKGVFRMKRSTTAPATAPAAP